MSYEDIISLPHPVSKKHPQMSMEDRAAQFSPFAALVGYGDSVAESNRQVEQFADFDENYLQELDGKLLYIRDRISEQPLVEITYFVPDEVKSGGAYRTLRERVKRIDAEGHAFLFVNRQSVSIARIVAIEILE